MKFPKSVHADGWLDRFEASGPGPRSDAPAAARADHRTRPDEPLGFAAAEVPPAAPEPARAAVSPWVIGAGAGIALVALAVSMSHNLSAVDAPAPPPTVTGQVQPPAPTPALPASPEEAQLAAAPSAAGPEATPPVAPARPEVAAAPAAKAARPEAPVARTLNARPEALARAGLPPAMPLESSRPVPAVAAPMPQLPPSALTEAAPPLAQAAPAELEDAGITAKVRMALSADALLAAVPIAVSTEHGVVKLEGQAPDAQVRERATAVAAATTGVKGVDNRLTLPPVASLGLAGNGG